MSFCRELSEPSANPLLNWSGVTELPLSLDVEGFRELLTALPARRSSDEEIIAHIAGLRSRLHGWLHQDELGPTRKQRTAALHAHLMCFNRLQKQLLTAPFRLRERINEKLTLEVDPEASVLLALYQAALDVEADLRNSTTDDVVEASRPRQQAYKLLIQLEVASTETDGDIYFTALGRNFDISRLAGADVNLAAVDLWLDGYGKVICHTLSDFNRRRGPDERVSLKLLVYELCQVWESETGSAVSAHGIVKNEDVGRAVTDAGRFITAAVELMLPDQSWFDQRAHFNRTSRSTTFLPRRKADRARQILVILLDYVTTRRERAPIPTAQ